MNQMPTLLAKSRIETGKSAAKRLRASGEVPAIAYGPKFDATTLAVAPKDVATILRSERGQNTVIKMSVDGKKDLLAMIKDYSYHPLTRALEHVDFVEVKLDEEVTVNIPLVFKGKAAGVTKGGIVRQVFRTVPVRSLPDRVPVKVEIDITHLELGEAIATKDLKLPEGVYAVLPEEQTLIAVVAPDKDRAAEEEAATKAALPGAAAAPAAGAAAAPAAAGAAKAAPAAAAKKK
ncbi:MAG: 50S ribosomal protein L25 [Polyangiaceae bacterium]|nr:50S ribosomal protein L25 [Polyangiaceae bacterium]